jgi:hypothetical protein
VQKNPVLVSRACNNARQASSGVSPYPFWKVTRVTKVEELKSGRAEERKSRKVEELNSLRV